MQQPSAMCPIAASACKPQLWACPQHVSQGAERYYAGCGEGNLSSPEASAAAHGAVTILLTWQSVFLESILEGCTIFIYGNLWV